MKQSIPERIKALRTQMLIHSYIYYELNNNLITDHDWQKRADELTQLQKLYPEHCKLKWYDIDFEGWDGSTGFHLPKDDWVVRKAHQILAYHEKLESYAPGVITTEVVVRP
jgi:hypothetical protein